MRVNELLNWQVASSPALDVADASVTKVFSSEQLQVIGQELTEAVGRYGDPADPDTAALLTWLDVQLKRNTVLTFGGGVNEVQRELIATAGQASRPRARGPAEAVPAEAAIRAAADRLLAAATARPAPP